MKKNLSYFALSGAMVIYGSLGMFRRWIPLSSALLACTRGLIGGTVLLLILLFRKKRLSMEKWPLLLLSGGLMGINWILMFEAFNRISVASATLCYYMAPTIIILVSPLLLKEKLTLKKGLCALVSVLGMVAVSGVLEGAQTLDFVGVLLALGAAVLYASIILLNKLTPTDDSFSKTSVQLFSSFVVVLPYVLLTEDFSAVSLTTPTVLLVLLVGVLHTGIAYALYFGSIPHLHGQTVAVLSYLDPVSALFFSAVFLQEKLSLLGILGAVLILGSAVISELNTKKTVH